MEPEDTSDTGFDIGAAMDEVATTLPPTDGEQTDLPLDDKQGAEKNTTDPDKAVEPEKVALPMPKSWAKEKEAAWTRLDDEQKEYYTIREKQMLDGIEQYKSDASLARQYKEVLTPYKPMLAAAGVSETEAVKFLLNAQYKMSHGTVEQRRAAYDEIGRTLGLVQEAATTGQATAPVDPRLNQLQDKLNRIESSLTQREQAELREAQTKANVTVEAFWSDKANVYVDEVATDMVPYINQGLSLKDAYDRAVWANPATRAKEQARIQTETEAKLKENARLNALKVRHSTSNNVRGTESQSAPTEPKGKLFDDMGDILKEIKSRAN